MTTRSKITATAIKTISAEEMIRMLVQDLMAEIPENEEEDPVAYMARIEFLLCKLPNDYSYLVSLLSYARSYVRIAKRGGSSTKTVYEDMMDKRDALESMASAVKLQYQAVSRILTARIQKTDEMSLHGYRLGGEDNG